MGKHSPVATVPRYMEQFRCAGGSCPENCCTGWTVAIDKASYQKYREVRQEPLAGLMRDSLERLDKGSHAAFARIRLRPDASCPFLDESRLCRIHGELGEQALSDTCAQYPRSYGLDGQDHLMYASLSCPEAARLALGAEDALEPVSLQLPFANAQLVPLAYRRDAAEPTEADPVRRHARLISEAVQALVRLPLLNAAQSLVQAGLMLRRMASIQTQGPAGDLELAQAMEHYLNPQNLAELPSLLAELQVPREAQLALLFETMQQYLSSNRGRPSFRALIQEVQQGLQLDRGADVAVARLEAALRERWAPLEAAHPMMLKNYLLNDIHKTLFPRRGMAEMEREFMDLAVRFALIKFLVLGLAAQRGDEFGIDDVVRVVYVTVRNIEHNTTFMKAVMDKLQASNMLRLEVLATLVL